MPEPQPGKVHAIVGATLINGRGGPPVSDAVVLVRDRKIVAAGPRTRVAVPDGAAVFEANGMSVLPGLLDCHFHMGAQPATALTKLWLMHGVTSLRDPGRPIEAYDPVRNDRDTPRLFLTGPHFDQAPPAHPHNAILVNSETEAREAVERYFNQGASAIKVYYRLRLELIRVVCEVAQMKRIPVTAHLELVDADAAIIAGLDGIEHVTSFGTALANEADAASFRAAVDTNNRSRENARFLLWSKLDLEHSPKVKPLIDLVVSRNIFVAPTLGIFERRSGDRNTEDYHLSGFKNMMTFVSQLHRSGAMIVVGSHRTHPHAESGWAFQHEMELLVHAGLTPLEAITASTFRNAQFLGCAERLGSIEVGKLADLVLVQGDPSRDIKAMYAIRRVMLNGTWVEASEPARVR